MPAFLPLADHGLDRRLLPGRLGLAHDLGVETIGEARLGKELLRLLDVARHLRQLEVVGMHRADMVMLGQLADILVGDLEHFGVVGGEPEGLADLRIVERLLVQAHARNTRLGGHHVRDVDVVHALVEIELLDVGVVDPVRLLGLHCRGIGRRIVAEVDELDRVDMGPGPRSP